MILALKEFGAPILILAAIALFRQLGFFSAETLSAALTFGTVFSFSVIILIAIMAYSHVIIRLLKNNTSTDVKNIVEDVQETKFKVNESFNILNAQHNQSGQMHYLIMNIYDVVKGIPNKFLIFENLIIRTRYLLNDSLEIILDYTVSNVVPTNPETIIRRQTKLNRQLTKLKIEYIESSIKISKDLLNQNNKIEIEKLLDTFFISIYDVTTSSKFEIEDILFKVMSELKDLEDSLKIIFKNITDDNNTEKTMIE
jgi:hypothetical protein